MKYRFLIFLLFYLLFYSGTAHSDDATSQGADSQSQKKGDEIWLEEKISPTTTWIENLVKPLTNWMEKQIQDSEQKTVNQPTNQDSAPDLSEQAEQVNINNTSEAGSRLSSEQAGLIAQEHIAGDVLYIKFVSKTNQYRVKLISEFGEVHIIYLKATSGEIVLPDNKTVVKSGNQMGSGGDVDDKTKEKP